MKEKKLEQVKPTWGNPENAEEEGDLGN